MTRAAPRLIAALALGTFLAGAPLGAGFGAGGWTLAIPKAFAKNGGDDRGGDDRGGRSDGGGRGGGDDHGGRSGGGDRGGRGGGDDHGGNRGDDSSSGKGGDDRGRGRGGDDDRSDDRGRGRGSDDRGGDDSGDGRGRSGSGGTAVLPRSSGSGVSVVKFERSSAGVEVTYSNGVKEEIENGRFEQKNAAGRTVIERPATAGDLARINANARNSGLAPARALPAGDPRRVEVSGGAIEVSYTTGWREEIEGGRYELKDPNNNTVVERPATAADLRRLQALAGR